MSAVVIMFWVLAAINFPPAIAALSPSQIKRLYGVDSTDKTLIALLQHRAILLGLVGAMCAVAAHVEAFRWPALIGAAISMTSFLLVCAVQKQFSGPLRKIAVIDAVGLPAVIVLFVLLSA